MSLPRDTRFLVFTDLDGSLLDHHSYSYQDAQKQLLRLEQLEIPVIPATSKTRAEIERLRQELGNASPFIVENGAAVFIPQGYFDSQPPGTVARDGYWIYELSARRQDWLDLLDDLFAHFAEEFETFARAGTQGIMRMTNLPETKAAEANQREYSEPVKWLGTPQRKEHFLACLREGGASVLQGGRFMAVSGDCDKGRALAWLRQLYQESSPSQHWHDLAAGDSANDCAMLEAAESALVIRSTVHDYPVLHRTQGVYYSRDYGPAGWAEGVARWLHSYQLTADI